MFSVYIALLLVSLIKGYINDFFILIFQNDPIKTLCWFIPRIYWLAAVLGPPAPRLHLSCTALLQHRVTVDALE